MQLVNIESKNQLNSFVAAQNHSQFMQSWQWGEFHQKVNGAVWRIGVEDSGQLVASAKVIKKALPMGKSYFYCGRGPIFSDGIWNETAAGILFEEIERLAKSEGMMFLRFDPLSVLPEDFSKKLIQTLDVQPSKTLVLDLSKPEEQLLKEMHQKTRYNINLAAKKGVEVVEAGADRFEDFWSLLDQTTDRDKFRPHGRDYYAAMLDAGSDFIKLLFAQYRGKPLATAIISLFGDSVTYLHGGSANDERNLMAPYALQWQAIKLAKSSGYKYYDFHGVDEEKWPGVTRFKKGFGGEEISYPGTFDLVYDNSWYSIYKMVRQVRRSF